MSYKDTNIANPGTSTQYGADDMELISRNFNGQAAGLPAVTIKNQNKWGFWDGIFYIRNQSDTWNITIRGPTNNPGNHFDLTLPPIIANSTLSALELAQTWTAKQRYNVGIVFPQISSPADPGVGLHNVFVSAAGHLQKIDHNLVIKDYDLTGVTVPVDIKDGVLATRQYDATVTKVGSTYYAIKYNGTVVSSGTNPNTVIQAAINITGDIMITAHESDYQIILQAGFAGFDIPAYTVIHIQKATNILVPNGYTGSCFTIKNGANQCGIVSNGGYITENDSIAPAKNWTAVEIGSGTSADSVWHVILKGFFPYACGTGIKFNQGSTGEIFNIEIDGIEIDDFKKGIVWVGGASNSIRNIIISKCKFTSFGEATDAFKDVSGTNVQFFGNSLEGFTGAMNEMNIT